MSGSTLLHPTIADDVDAIYSEQFPHITALCLPRIPRIVANIEFLITSETTALRTAPGKYVVL